MNHAEWCLRDEDGEHADGTDLCAGVAFSVGGVTGFLARADGRDVFVVDERELDRGQTLKLVAELAERAEAMTG